MTNISKSRKLLLLQNGENKLQRVNEDIKRCLSDQPKFTAKISHETNKINELKCTLKKKLDTQLLLDQELIELEKKVQIKQNKTTTINKRLIKSKKSFQSDKKKLYQCKKNLTTWQFKLRKIKLRNSDKKFPIQSIENLITKIFKERLQAKITVTMEKMFDIENSCIKKEDQIDQEAFNFKICEKDQIKCEKELLNQYDEKIKIQKLLLELENKLQIHQKKLDEASNQLQRVIQETSSNDKMRTNIKYYLKKDKNHELTESDYYYLNQI